MKILWFPRSSSLDAHWWHRLAKVVFWVWFVLVLAYFFVTGVLNPHEECLQVKRGTYGDILRDLDCGSNAIDYFWITSTNTGLTLAEDTLLALALAFLIYALLMVPSLLYRLALYVAKGSSWKDKASAIEA